MTALIATYDERETRCPMLGHGVPFQYCRTVQEMLPCRKIADCWFETFDIETYLLQNYNHHELKEMTKPGPPKITTILEMIEKAQKQ